VNLQQLTDRPRADGSSRRM